jgi:serine phosphatase RsbU (regulator of sigma subunit)
MSRTSRRYTADDVMLAQSVAARIASSIENLRLYEQQRVIARTLQHSLLPAALPTIPGVEVAVRYWPAGEANDVGGDFYDVFALDPPGQWAVVIGDVCGTGPAAAALTGLARHSMRDSAWHGDDPVEVLRSLNRAVKNSATGSFITAIYATLDTTGPRPHLTVASGGHPLPIHVPAGATGATEVGTPGTLLGMFDPARFETATRPLGVGDVVVFYTDGATDVHPPHNLDRSQFLDLVQGAVRGGGDAELVADNIRDALENVVPFSRRNDDIALLVLRVIEAADALPPA